jgi:hypothetical protein
LLSLLLLVITLITGCTGGAATPEPLPDTLEVLTKAATNIRAAKTFRMVVDRTGAEYRINTDLGTAVFKRGEVAYVAPETLQAKVRVLAASIPLDLDFFFKADKQWLRGIWTNNAWVSINFAPGFNPQALIAEQTGFQAALKSLRDIKMVGRENLIDGTPVYHIAATATGEAVSAFMAGLINVEGDVTADVYVDQKSFMPLRFVIVQTKAQWEPGQTPTTWNIDVFDFDKAVGVNDPEATHEPKS